MRWAGFIGTGLLELDFPASHGHQLYNYTLRKGFPRDIRALVFGSTATIVRFRSQASHVRSFFKHPDLVAIMEWPVLFLGGSPKSVPAMYSLMNYAAVELGTWYLLSERLGITTWRGLQGTSAKIMKSE